MGRGWYHFINDPEWGVFVVICQKNICLFIKEIGKIELKKQTTEDFGGLKTGWVCCIPAGMSVIFLSKMENLASTNPQSLNEFPNNLYIYYVHVLNPTLIVLPLVCLYYSQNKELRRAVKNIFFPVIDPNPQTC